MEYGEQARRILIELHQQVPLEQMAGLIQHGTTSTYQHCLNVVLLSVLLAERFSIAVDLPTLVQGAMLHDFYCYDWHQPSPDHRWHGFCHPRLALCQALRYLDLEENCRGVILSHMWPLTLFHYPRSREAWLVCLADKYCALAESMKLDDWLRRETQEFGFSALSILRKQA